jgi:TonB family protein
MSRSLVLLSSLMMLAAGCRHVPVPTLPASHGHLSLAADQYLDLKSGMPASALPNGTPEVVVEPAEAPAVFQEAVQVLRGKPTASEVQQALSDLEAACDVPLQEACDFLRENFKGPEKIKHHFPQYPPQALKDQALAMVILRCRLGIDGKFHTCEILEAAPYGFTEAVIEAAREMKYRPATLAGHPIDIPYRLNVQMSPTGLKLTPQERLQWLRIRSERFPESLVAWSELAHMLAEHAPEDPAYVPALQHLNKLVPRYWWSANELAWIHVQAGRYAEAAPLARQARKKAPRNPYVLETSAAVLFGLGQCKEALADQQSAAKELPKPWPGPEKERFQLKQEEYTRQCATASAAQPR